MLWAAVFVEEGGECTYASNVMLFKFCEKSPVLVFVAVEHELPGEIRLPLFDLVKPPYQDVVVERRCGAFPAGGALHGAPFLQCCVLLRC